MAEKKAYPLRINAEVLARMPSEIQDALDQASENAIVNGLEEMDALGDRACADLREAGTPLSAMPADAVQDWKQRAGIDRQWVDRYTERGYDAEGVLADFRRIIAEESQRSSYADPFVECLKGQDR